MKTIGTIFVAMIVAVGICGCDEKAAEPATTAEVNKGTSLEMNAGGTKGTVNIKDGKIKITAPGAEVKSGKDGATLKTDGVNIDAKKGVEVKTSDGKKLIVKDGKVNMKDLMKMNTN